MEENLVGNILRISFYLMKKGKNGNNRRIDIVKYAIALGKFTLMNATYAKQPFSEKIICAVIKHLLVQVLTKVLKFVTFRSYWHTFKIMWTELSKSITIETNVYLIETHAMLEYIIVVHGLFIESLLNKKWNLIRNNIDKSLKL